MTVELEFSKCPVNLSGWHNSALATAAENASDNSPVGSLDDVTVIKRGGTLIVRLDGKLADLSSNKEANLIDAFTSELADLGHVETREV